MTEAMVFGILFLLFFVLRAVAATIFFYFLLPQGDRCPNCDAATVRVQSRVWNALAPYLRTSWCYECGWEGALRHGPLTPAPHVASHAKQD